MASQERRKQEWELQKCLADQDYLIGEQQEKIADDHVAITTQEQAISTIQTQEAKATADFLARKFTNVELYEWMSGVMAGVYNDFLQQATSVAQPPRANWSSNARHPRWAPSRPITGSRPPTRVDRLRAARRLTAVA